MKFTKLTAVEYLVQNNVYQDEWTGAGMYEAIEAIIKSEEKEFTKEYLDGLLKDASNF